MKQEIKKDILVCEELLQKDYIEGKEFSNIIGKYKTKYPNFSDGLKNYAISVGVKGPNQIENVKILKSKLELLLVEIQNPILYESNSKVNNTTFNVSNSNSNNNTNENHIHINFTLDDVRKNIEENTYISDNEKEELLQKLEEIKQLQKSKESKTKKWDIAKEILKFILDKGADIAIMFIPQILKAIQ